MTTKKNELTVLEDINTDIVTSERVHIPLASVMGQGRFHKKDSFGGRSLAENAVMVDSAMQNLDELQDVYNRSHTQWIWKHITFSWLDPLSNLRQVAAEMQRKRSALQTAKWKHIKTELKIKKLEDQLLHNEKMDKFKTLELKIKLCELKEGIEEGNSVIEGALKDVLAINQIYEELKAQVDGMTEEDLEKEQSKSHLKRSFMQSIRDVRERGSITKGEQEYMEQVGVNPSKIQTIFRKYVEDETKDDSWDNTKLIKFIENIVDDLIDNHQVDIARMSAIGFSPETNTDIIHHKRIAEKKQ